MGRAKRRIKRGGGSARRRRVQISEMLRHGEMLRLLVESAVADMMSGGMRGADPVRKKIRMNGLTATKTNHISGSGMARRRAAARTVFLSKQAIVIGPTPPGTGVIARARAAAPA